MPILDTSTRDYNGTMRDNTRIRQTGNAGLIQPQEEEQRIADAVLQDRLEVKNTPLSRMTGLKTTVVYYQQKTIGRNDYLVNTAGLNTIDVNKFNFIKIEGFVIICQGDSSYQANSLEMSIDVNVDGEAKVLPKTIQPLVGDRFIMNVGDKNCLFKVTGVNKTTIETDSAYTLNYTLEEDVLGEKYSQVESCGYGCGNSGCSGVCTNVCKCSCGNGCGSHTCSASCISSNCAGNTCIVGCANYCIYGNCSFSCGGGETIETSPSPSGCSGQCSSSSSCSATGQEWI